MVVPGSQLHFGEAGIRTEGCQRKEPVSSRLIRCSPPGWSLWSATQHTRDDVSRIHRIVILDEAEAIHELDLGDGSSLVSGKVFFDVRLGDCESGQLGRIHVWGLIWLGEKQR